MNFGPTPVQQDVKATADALKLALQVVEKHSFGFGAARFRLIGNLREWDLEDELGKALIHITSSPDGNQISIFIKD